MNVVEKLAAEGHLTEEQVGRIGRSVADFMDAVRKDPALMKEAMEKSGQGGFLGSAWGHAKSMAPYAAGSALLGGAMGLTAHAAKTGFGAAQDHIQKAQSYKTMISENPQLAQADPGLVQKAFNTLHRFNPEYAGDPLVAGTFVQNVVEQERLDIGTVKSLVDARKAMSQGGGGRGSEFFSMPPHDIGQKMENGQRQTQQRSELHGESMEKAKYETARARDEAARAELQYDKEEG